MEYDKLNIENKHTLHDKYITKCVFVSSRCLLKKITFKNEIYQEKNHLLLFCFKVSNKSIEIMNMN